MEDGKKLLLSDAIKEAISTYKRVIWYRNALAVSAILNIILIILLVK